MRWLKEYGGGGPPVTKLKDPFMGHTPSGKCFLDFETCAVLAA